MALITCHECGQQVSSEAASCPRCGAPVTKPTPPPPAKPKQATGLGSLVAVGLMIWLAFSLFGGGCSASTRSVTYRVDGTASSASLTYANEQGGTQQETVSLPWERSMRAKAGSFLYISAQNQGSSGGLTVRITVDGSEFKQSSASGAYTIADASGPCP